MSGNHFTEKHRVKDFGSHKPQKMRHISSTISFRLLIIAGIVFLTAALITFMVLAIGNRDTFLGTMKSFVELDIEDFNNKPAKARETELKSVVSMISGVLDWQEAMKKEESLELLLDQWISREYMSELVLVDPDGKVVCSNQADIIGSDLAENGQYASALSLFGQPEGTIAVCSDVPISTTPIQYYTAMKTVGHDLLLLMGTTREDEEYIRRKVIDDYLSADLSLYPIWETGYVLRADRDMTVRTSNNQQCIGMNLQDMGFPLEKDKEYSQSYIISIEGEKVLTYVDNSLGFYIVYAFTLREVIQEPLKTLRSFLIVLILVCLVIYMNVTLLVRNKVLKNIEKVNQSLACIVQGKLDQKVDVRDFLEFDSLSENINRTVDRLKELIDERGKRIEKELAFAKAVQLSSLPSFSSVSSRDEIAIDAFMEPVKEVGGDFYDFFFIGENRLGLVIADVSGKGIPAAMFMMKSEALIRDRALKGGTPGEILSDVNAALLGGSQAGYFVTVWFAILDLDTGEGSAVNAGHTDPIVRRTSGEFILERYPHQLVVGAMDGINYKSHDFRLNPGDCLFVYTDGVTEAINSAEEQFGKTRILEVLNKKAGAPPRELIRNLRRSITRFTGDMEQFDDVTMLCIEYIGPKES